MIRNLYFNDDLCYQNWRFIDKSIKLHLLYHSLLRVNELINKNIQPQHHKEVSTV